MASKKANAQANLDAAKEIFKAVNGIGSLANEIKYADRFSHLEAARVALNTAYDASLQAMRMAEKILAESERDPS